jgi:hypothetical protein
VFGITSGKMQAAHAATLWDMLPMHVAHTVLLMFTGQSPMSQAVVQRQRATLSKPALPLLLCLQVKRSTFSGRPAAAC